MFSSVRKRLAWIVFRATQNGQNISKKEFFSERFIVFPEHRLFVNLIFKNANSFLIKVLDEIVNGKNDLDANTLRNKSLLKVRDLTLPGVLDLSGFDKLVVVRSPYTRALSSFLDRIGSGRRLEYREIRGYGDPTLEGFKEFLTDLDRGVLYYDPHFRPQCDQMLFPLSAFTSVIHFERLESELMSWLRGKFHKDADVSEMFTRSTRMVNLHQTHADEKVASFLDVESRELIRRSYRTDFELLHYPK